MISFTDSESVTIHLHLNIINRSSQSFNLFDLEKAVKTQLTAVFNLPFQGLALEINSKVLYRYKLKQLYQQMVLAITDQVKHGNPAETHFKGLLISVNKNFIASILSNQNKRTLAHEFGHALGLDHPHAPALFKAINPNAHPLEQQIPLEELPFNLMSQTWYVQKEEVPINEALCLHPKQIQLIKHNLINNRLNQNYSIHKGLLTYHWI